MPEDTCIYCKTCCKLTTEHVMPKALGGDATAKLVCDACRFSHLDQALAERSFVSMDRAAFTAHDAFKVTVGADTFVYSQDHGLYLEAAIENEMTAVPRPQFHFREREEGFELYLFVADETAKRRLIKFVDRQIVDGSLRSLHVRVGPAEYCSTVRIAMHRSDEGFVRAASRESATAVLERVVVRWRSDLCKALEQATCEVEVIERPRVKIAISTCIDNEYRAIAKIAFNVMAMDFGRDFALLEVFDPIRDYISGKDIRHPQNLAPDEVAIDHRFVEKAMRGGRSVMPTDAHVVLIDNIGANLLACVTLYGSHGYCVRLAAVASPKFGSWCREFSIDRSGSRVLDPMEMYRRQLT